MIDYCKVWENGTDLEEIWYEYMDWIQLTQDKLH